MGGGHHPGNPPGGDPDGGDPSEGSDIDEVFPNDFAPGQKIPGPYGAFGEKSPTIDSKWAEFGQDLQAMGSALILYGLLIGLVDPPVGAVVAAMGTAMAAFGVIAETLATDPPQLDFAKVVELRPSPYFTSIRGLLSELEAMEQPGFAHINGTVKSVLVHAEMGMRYAVAYVDAEERMSGARIHGDYAWGLQHALMRDHYGQLLKDVLRVIITLARSVCTRLRWSEYDMPVANLPTSIEQTTTAMNGVPPDLMVAIAHIRLGRPDNGSVVEWLDRLTQQFMTKLDSSIA